MIREEWTNDEGSVDILFWRCGLMIKDVWTND